MSLKFPFLKSCLPGMKQGLATLMVLQLLIGAPVSALAAEDRNDNAAWNATQIAIRTATPARPSST